MKQNQKIIICPTEEKMRLLEEYNSESMLYDIKFFTKDEFLKKYFYSYDERAISYLMHTYHWNLDVVRTYLSSLFVIEEEKKYKSEKLKFLQKLKMELKEKGFFTYSPSFKKYLKNKEIEVIHYYDLNLYEEEVFNHKVEVENVSLSFPVHCFQTMEEEVNFVCLEIIKLLKKGISPNRIFLTNVSENYYYTLKKLFNYYHIPITIPFHNSIYSSEVVSNYLKSGELPLEDVSKNEILEKVVSLLAKYYYLDLDDSIDKSIFIDLLKNTYFSNEIIENSIRIKDFYKEKFLEEDYVFVLGFNQDSIPRNFHDTDFISDSIKNEVSLYPSVYLNKREKMVTAYLLSQIRNITVSFKESTPFEVFYPSPFIKDYSLEIISLHQDSYQYSDLYNQIRLGEKLDSYYLYGEKSDSLSCLYSHYKIPYRTYSNAFTGISRDTYLENLPYPLTLSYTSLNSYNECAFQYYIKQVLKLNLYEDTFSSFIGSMYHKILSLYKRSNFDFDREFQSYLEKRDLQLKETLLLHRIKKDLLTLLDVLKEQEYLTGFNDALYEERVEIPLEKDVSVVFVGYIDKIMYYQNIEDTYFSIIDYKTGTIDTHIEPMKYGLHMQLPVYLYLIHYGRVFSNPIFSGIYYQNILFPYPTWSPKLEIEKSQRYYLNGYSTDQVDILSRFDSTYENSTYIKSMKYSEEKGFGTYTKILDDNMLSSLVQYTKNHIEEKTDEILDAKFSIHPKIYAGKNISCLFCKFKDLCFYTANDFVYLDKVDDLSFLGGEE